MDSKKTKINNIWTIALYFIGLYTSVVNAQQRPRILEHPANAIAARDEPLTLNCKATGRPLPDISWYHNGTPLPSEPERRVVLPEGALFFLRVEHNKRERDGGIYWCEAKNSAGIAVSNNATLQIAVLKDEFRSVPKDAIALVGGPLVMNCTPPRGVPEPSVLWYKNGRLLDLSGKRLSMVEGGSLMISEVQAGDAGSYECSAQNMAGKKNAPSAVLKVLTPPIVVRGPTDTEVVEGEGMDIPCDLAGDPKPIVSWNRDGGTLPEGRSRTLLDNTLRIEDVRAEDRGTYTCTGYNEGGNISLSIELSVFATPTFTEAPTDVDVAQGDTLNLPCRATGRPKTVIIWDKIYFGASSNLQDEIVQLTEESLRSELLSKAKIMSLRSKRNTLSRNRTQRSILISDDNDEKDDINSLVTENTSFIDVGAVAVPELPSFEVGNSGELIIKDIMKKDEGWYACTAINEAGSIVKKVYIHVKAPSDPDVDFQIPDLPGSRWGNSQNILINTIIPVSSSSLDVTWETGPHSTQFVTKSMTLYYRAVYSNDGDSRILSKEYLMAPTSVEKKICRLEDLKPYTLYEVFATMPKGLAGAVSNVRKGKTLDGPPSAPPTNVRVGFINNTAAYVRWSPPPQHLINGELTGYNIQIKSNVTNKLLGEMSLNATTQSVVINFLSPGGRYTARVAPLTIGGIGPFSPPAALHMDPSFIARAPKADPAMSSFTMSWMPGVALGILCICLISGAVFAVFWARRNKRNLKASYPAPVLTSTLNDKSHTLWMHNNTTIKPTHTYSVPPPPPPVPSEYAEVSALNIPKLNNQMAPPEPYATVTLQRGGGVIPMNGTLMGMGTIMSNGPMLDDSCRKCSASPSSSEYNAPVRMPMNICEMLPPPPDHPYGSYKPINNMTIRTNPAALSPQVMRRGPPVWGTLPPPPIPNFPQNWIPERQQGSFAPPPPSNQHIYSENEYESGSVLYEQFCRDNEASYFNEGGEPTEEYYRNVNMEFFEDQDFEPATPPPPCPDSATSKMNPNLRLIAANNRQAMHDTSTTNSRRMYRTGPPVHHHSRDSSCDRNGSSPVVNNGTIPTQNGSNSSDESESGDSRWVPRSRRSRSRSKSNERRFRGDQ